MVPGLVNGGARVQTRVLEVLAAYFLCYWEYIVPSFKKENYISQLPLQISVAY